MKKLFSETYNIVASGVAINLPAKNYGHDLAWRFNIMGHPVITFVIAA